jgi:diketogulonate reductase-like aldo/keto reductase
MIQRKIPSSGELLPVIGLGSWAQFDVGTSKEERTPLRDVLTNMEKEGGTLIDSSPMYGKSEQVIGDLTSQLPIAGKFFYATKVWTNGEQEGIAQMNDSMKKMRRATMDLMQIHNLVDWKTHVKTLRQWKGEGKIRYLGVTHYTVSSHEQLEQVIRSEKMDFVQFNYSICVRNAERRLLRAATETGTAVIINEPFEKGTLFQLVRGKQLPEWSREYGMKTWTEFFLKYIIADTAVNCVIPGTSNPQNVVANMSAGDGMLPDNEIRKRMVEFAGTL